MCLCGTEQVRTVAGVPAKSAAGVDGVHDASRFNTPMGLALDEEAGVLYVADSHHHCIKRIALLSGEVTTVVPAGRGLRHPIDLVGKHTGNRRHVHVQLA